MLKIYHLEGRTTSKKEMVSSWMFHFDHLLIVLLIFVSLFHLHLSNEFESDSITPGERLSGNRTLISRHGVFEMGFFAPPGNSQNYYVGIWYKGLPMPEKTVVWVANRDNPVSDPYSSWLELGKDGYLVLKASNGLAIWSANIGYSLPPSYSTVGTLGVDGNFMISQIPFWVDEEEVSLEEWKTWQSFDNPTDTWLPGAMLGYDLYNEVVKLKSWKNTSNPSTGHFSVEISGVDPQWSEVQLLLKNGFDDSKFCINRSYIFQSDHVNVSIDFNVASGGFESYYVVMEQPSHSCLARYVLDVSGQLKLLIWLDYSARWHTVNTRLTTCHSRSGYEENKRIAAKMSGMKNATRVVMVTSVCAAIVFVGITVLLIVFRRKSTVASITSIGEDTLKQYRHRDLRRATRNYTCKLGKGGFSTVYKGEFPDSTFVAVKELRGQLQEDKQLRAELSTLGLIQHKNLVRLRGFCLEGSKRFIIYDYMPNGSLEPHLFPMDSSNVLDWGTRYSIALGTAKGLAYLHEECRDCIIHCDIKPENILLDAEFNPKVADFGLAKLLSRNFSRVLTTMRGTRGYLAPEWFSGEPVTTKVDVYSYGQVLFEIVSGRRNMDLSNNDLSSYFPALVLNALNSGGEILNLVDSKLEGEFNAEEVTRACTVACWCIQEHEKDRPTMKQVVQILEGLLDVGIPPIPRFFLSIAEASTKKSDITASESYGTSSSRCLSLTFQPQDQSIQHSP